MKSPFACLGIVALFAVAPAVAAQNASHQSSLPRRAAVAPVYDLSKEVAVQGAIQDVVRKPAAGLMIGDHLMVTTPQGTLDVQIGKLLLRGRDAVSFNTGEQVRAIGMISTFHGRTVLLARLVQTSGGTFEVRNEHGIEISPALRKALAQQGSTAGGAQ
jgi:hypothetical protein